MGFLFCCSSCCTALANKSHYSLSWTVGADLQFSSSLSSFRENEWRMMEQIHTHTCLSCERLFAERSHWPIVAFTVAFTSHCAVAHFVSAMATGWLWFEEMALVRGVLTALRHTSSVPWRLTGNMAATGTSLRSDESVQNRNRCSCMSNARFVRPSLLWRRGLRQQPLPKTYRSLVSAAAFMAFACQIAISTSWRCCLSRYARMQSLDPSSYYDKLGPCSKKPASVNRSKTRLRTKRPCASSF